MAARATDASDSGTGGQMMSNSRRPLAKGAITGMATTVGAGVGIVIAAIIGWTAASALLLVGGAAVGVVIGTIIEAHRER